MGNDICERNMINGITANLYNDRLYEITSLKKLQLDYKQYFLEPKNIMFFSAVGSVNFAKCKNDNLFLAHI
ncbi:hypothetical protein A9970_20765 [Sphingobacterium sp. UME9]|nr:hypothetical protein [Sphingobacterium sp. UME9]